MLDIDLKSCLQEVGGVGWGEGRGGGVTRERGLVELISRAKG